MFFIHPHSRFRLLWAVLITLLVTYTAFLTPFRIAFSYPLSLPLTTINYIIDFILCIDIFLNFHTGYVKESLVIKDPRLVARRYFHRWFFLDLIATLPFESFVLILLPQYAAIAPALGLLKLLRLIRLVYLFSTIQRRVKLNPALTRVILLAYTVGLYAHWVACLWFYIGTYETENRSWLYDNEILNAPAGSQYLWSVYWVITTMTTVGYGDITPTTNLEVVFTLLIMVAGVSIYAYIIGNMASMIANFDSSAAEFKRKLLAVDDYIRYNNLPETLRQKINDYYEYVWDSHKYYDETEVVQDLPETLRIDIAMFLNRNVINKVPLFSGVEQGVLSAVALMLRPQLYLPGDYIIREGEIGTAMYFLTHGQVSVFVNQGKEHVSTLESGSFFGEMALLFREKRAASVLANTHCEVYVLTKEDFDVIVEAYPDLKRSIEKVANERRQSLGS